MKFTPEDHLVSVSRVSSAVLLNVAQYHDGRPRVSLVQPKSPQWDPDHLQRNYSGFLYYHQPPRAPPLAGELRFRLTASRNPASFPFGLDLMTKRGVPWSVPLPVVAGNRSFAPIRHILTTVDATVPQQVMDIARNHHQKSHSGDVAGTRHLYAFFQPFDLALDRNYVAFAFVGKESIAYTTLQHIASFQTRRNGEAPQLYTPFSGPCAARVLFVIFNQLTRCTEQEPSCAVSSRPHYQSIPGSVSHLYAYYAPSHGIPFGPIRPTTGLPCHPSSARKKASC